MKKYLFGALTILFIVLGSNVYAQTDYDFSNPKEQLPIDPAVTMGTLDNGLVYYIRENHKPEDRAELRLVVNAGSILETEAQQGLAHFCEHMCFNGTDEYAENELIDFLELLGMKFGPEINAYTSFDETVYMLLLPTDTVEVFEQGFDVLKEWANNVAFEDKAIDDERGVIIEEWRSGRGASARMRDEQFPIIFKNSQYASRLPIGKKDILESFEYNTLRSFYNEWYRPNLMAVVAVGDFKKEDVEVLIKKYFGELSNPEDAKERKYFDVPDHEETLYAIASDKEATNSVVSIYFKRDLKDFETVGDYRDKLIEMLYDNMFNQRLQEKTREAEPPFVYGTSGSFDLVRTKGTYAVLAMVKEGQVPNGLEALITEAERVKQHGFTEGELNRAKQRLLKHIETSYKEKDKTESKKYANEYISHFLQNAPFPGIDYEYALWNEFMDGISLEEINKLAEEYITDGNRVVVVSYPEKEGVDEVTAESLESVLAKVKASTIEAYVDQTNENPLFAEELEPGRILMQKTNEELGLTEMKLFNGIKVILKQTDFKNDEILFQAYSPGGHSLSEDEQFLSSKMAAWIVNQSGIGEFSAVELENKLSGKVVSVNAWISETEEGLTGSASPDDLETMFQLIHMQFTQPRMDKEAFDSYMSKQRSFLENRDADPKTALSDTLTGILSQYHFRAKPITIERLDEVKLQEAVDFYKDRFADASDFTFVFVGNFDKEVMEENIKKYIASLPDIDREESYRDVGIRYPEGVIERTIHKGIEPKSNVQIFYTGSFEFTYENRILFYAMLDALRIRLREVIREEKGGTYGVRVSGDVDNEPLEEYSINISFDTDPERVEELEETVYNEIENLKENGPEQINIDKVKETEFREKETNLKLNKYWLNTLRWYTAWNENPEIPILNYEEYINKITIESVQAAAKKYFNNDNHVSVTLLPE